MKKLQAIATIVGVLALPVFALAQSYDSPIPMTPAALTQSQVMSTPINVPSGLYYDFASPALDGDDSSNLFLGGSVITPTPSVSTYDNTLIWNWIGDGETSPPPVGDYIVVAYNSSAIASDDCSVDLSSESISLSQLESDCAGLESAYGINYYTFSVLADATPISLAITMPTSTTPAISDDLDAQFADQGTLRVVALVAGISLTFYVIEQLIALLPGNTRPRK